MVDVTFIQPDGAAATVAGVPGESVMQTALNHDIAGIIGECGGSMACATCHVHVDPAWAGRTGARSDSEADMLDCAASEMLPTSRLACQISLTEDLHGLRVSVPDRQI